MKFIFNRLQFLVIGVLFSLLAKPPLWSWSNLLLFSWVFVSVVTVWYLAKLIFATSSLKRQSLQVMKRQKDFLQDIPMPTRLEVNAAIDRLIETSLSNPEDGRQIVIFVCQNPPTSVFSMSGSRTTRQGSQVTSVTKEFGIPTEKVGYYKIYWFDNEITIQRFWQIDPAANVDSTEQPEEYVLYFDPETLVPTAFGVVEYDDRRFRIGKLFLDVSFQQIKMLDDKHLGQTISYKKKTRLHTQSSDG
jgi:hypothetical protein